MIYFLEWLSNLTALSLVMFTSGINFIDRHAMNDYLTAWLITKE